MHPLGIHNRNLFRLYSVYIDCCYLKMKYVFEAKCLYVWLPTF